MPEPRATMRKVTAAAANAPAMALYESCGGVRETFDDVMWVFPLDS